MYANIIIDLTLEKLDHPFQYLVPEQLQDCLLVGMPVCIPFGRGNRQIKGYVMELTEKAEYDPSKIKPILSIIREEMSVEDHMIQLAAWIRAQYGSTMAAALKTVLPVRKKKKNIIKRTIRLLPSREEAKIILEENIRKNNKARVRLLEALLLEEELDYATVVRELKLQADTLQKMSKAGIIEITSHSVYRSPLTGIETSQWKEKRILTQAQRQVVDHIDQDRKQGIYKTYLLHGVTGSGKTEVYMELIERVVREKKQAILLIPEIALTYQMVTRFRNRFGDRISIMNSRLSEGERSDQMELASQGKVDIMIGPRSALFTPFPRLGLIIIDEEHEQSYKSEQVPRYHARETAEKLAQLCKASVLLGSATPSLEAFYRAKKGEYELLTLKERVGSGTLPQVEILDMRAELQKGNRSIFCHKLQDMIGERLEKKEQIMLFLNRRGYAGFVSCRSCGHVITCPHCEVSLSYHSHQKMCCHYCGYEEPVRTVCPECGSSFIGRFKAGTQQIEELLQRQYPEARLLRMDMDTTRKKGEFDTILSSFSKGEADILLGTQMIVKGHDFPKVTLVGILAADLSLNISDYRASERTFQLLTQAAGRAGRGERKGEVVIQTYHPEHYSILAASHQNYEEFYNQEILFRKLMGYPPVSHLLCIWMECENQEHLERAAGYLKQMAETICKNHPIQIIGPANPGIAKIKDHYRKVIYIKDPTYSVLIKIKDKLEDYIEMNTGFRTVNILFDFDPMNV